MDIKDSYLHGTVGVVKPHILMLHAREKPHAHVMQRVLRRLFQHDDHAVP